MALTNYQWTSLSRVSSMSLKEGDVFKTRASLELHLVILVTDQFVHAMTMTTERFVRLNHSTAYAPDHVYLVGQREIPGRFKPDGAETRFLIAG